MGGTVLTEYESNTVNYHDFVSILKHSNLVASNNSIVDECAIGRQVSQEYGDLAFAYNPIYQAVTIGYIWVIDDQVFEKSAIRTAL